MARGIVGALVHSVGLGKLTPADLERLLHSKKRTSGNRHCSGGWLVFGESLL